MDAGSSCSNGRRWLVRSQVWFAIVPLRSGGQNRMEHSNSSPTLQKSKNGSHPPQGLRTCGGKAACVCPSSASAAHRPGMGLVGRLGKGSCMPRSWG